MHITTENIEEWCFRYLEKDLSSNEIVFFEKELRTNSDLSLELSKWKKTFLTNDEVLPNNILVEQSLYRFKHQIALLLAESVLVIGMCAGLFMYEDTESNTTKPIDKPAVMIEQTKPQEPILEDNNERVFILNKPVTYIQHKNKTTDTSSTLAEKTVVKTKQTDSLPQSDIVNTDTIENTFITETIKDSSQFVKKPKAPAKKSNVKRKYSSGSRIIPLNNDL